MTSGTQAATKAPAAGSGTGSRSAEVSVNSVTPTVPENGDTLTLTGTVTNNSKATIGRGRIGVRVGPSLDSRSAIDQAGKRQGYLSGADGTEVDRKYAVKAGTLPPGISRPFTLKVPVSALRLSADGVYQLGVSLSGQTRARPYEQILGIGRTFLPWQEGASGKKTELTYLWPLISSTHMTARTESDEQQTPVFHDDTLVKELAPGGRLQQMVALGEDLPITWVIDPDLLATVDMMTKRYRVEKEGGGTVAGRGQEHAKKWLDDLQRAVRGEEVVALPFADPDLASLAHRGRSAPATLKNLSTSTERGKQAVDTVLHTKPSTDFAWPVNGAVDSSIVDVATSAGAHNVISRSDSIRDSSLSYTPTSARPIGSGHTALVADARLSTAFQGDMTNARASSLAVQEFIAQSLSISRQVPTRQRSILVAPQRTPTASQAQAMAEGIRALDESGQWTESSRLEAAAEAKPDPGADRRVPGPSSYPASLRRDELPVSAFEQVRQTQTTLGDFKVILSRSDRVVPPFGSAIDREISTSWRGKPRPAAAFRDAVQEYLLDLKGRVRLIKKSDITLSGREATIPVTVQNNLGQRVDGLYLELESGRRIGLDVGEAKPIKVDGGHSQSVKFDTTAKANGRTVVKAQLYTKDHKPYGKPMTFQVNVTSITATVLLVIAGGVLLMVLAGIRMYTQRKRKGPAPDPDALLEQSEAEEPGESEPRESGETESESGEPAESDEAGEADEAGESGEADEADEAGAAGEPEGDTEPQNDNPPGTGEKVDR
ncbi:DUF6049 family protein [Streptomyces albiaxialis]|uniref:DUF6049 family protein n=1 Tax=Streptomyces albiaxialis TaxID=329523 RepID=A0ABP5HSH9_9ACTN